MPNFRNRLASEIRPFLSLRNFGLLKLAEHQLAEQGVLNNAISAVRVDLCRVDVAEYDAIPATARDVLRHAFQELLTCQLPFVRALDIVQDQ